MKRRQCVTRRGTLMLGVHLRIFSRGRRYRLKIGVSRQVCANCQLDSRHEIVDNSSTNAFIVTMREFVDEFSELDVLTFDQRMRRILMRSTNFVDDSFVAEFVDEFVTCGGGFNRRYYTDSKFESAVGANR